MFEFYYPSFDLAHIIKHFWAMTSDYSTDEVLVYPEGNAELIFHFGEPFVNKSIENSEVRRQTRAMLCCQKTVASFASASGFTSMLAATLTPIGAYSLFGFDLAEYKNTNIDLTCIFGDGFNLLLDKLSDSKNNRDRIAELERFFRSKYKPLRETETVGNSINLLKNTLGKPNIPKLSKEVFLSTRQFERIFSKVVGLAPIQYNKILRINRSIEMIKNNSGRADLTQIAYENGFYDQSHFIRTFKHTVGLLPSEFERKCIKIDS